MQLWIPVGVYLAIVCETYGTEPTPSGVYFEASNEYFMQAVILSETKARLEFAHRGARSVFNMGDVPFALDPVSRTFTLYPDPAAANSSVVVAAIGKCINRPMEFPAEGQWFPDEDRLALNFNKKLWDMQKVAVEQDLLQLILHDDNAPQSAQFSEFSFYGNLLPHQLENMAAVNGTFVPRKKELFNSTATSAAAKGFIMTSSAAVSVTVSLLALLYC